MNEGAVPTRRLHEEEREGAVSRGENGTIRGGRVRVTGAQSLSLSLSRAVTRVVSRVPRALERRDDCPLGEAATRDLDHADDVELLVLLCQDHRRGRPAVENVQIRERVSNRTEATSLNTSLYTLCIFCVLSFRETRDASRERVRG